MTVITNTPRAGETAEQIEARNAPRGQIPRGAENSTRKAELFYLNEPSRGIYIVSVQIGNTLMRVEISRDQLANFLVDGTAIAHRSDLKAQQGETKR